MTDLVRPAGALVATAPAYEAASTNRFGITNVGSHADPSFVDVDGDGDLDLFIGNGVGNTLFFRNSGSSSAPAYANPTPGINPFGITNADSYAKPTLVDVDGDGDLDLFIGNLAGNTLFFRNSGSSSAPAYVAAGTNPFGITNAGPYPNLSIADVDGDGDLDLFIGNMDGNTIFFRNNATAGATAPAYEAASTNPFGITNAGNYAKPSLVDVDGDGDLDLFIGNMDGTTFFFRNSGSSSAPAYVAANTNPFGITDVGYVAIPTLSDVDGDGDLDLFIGNSAGNTLFFRNSGSTSAPAYEAASTNPFGITDVGDIATPSFADIDRDGDLDLFIGNRVGNTLFFRNSGSSSAPAYDAASTNPFGITDVGDNATPSFADIDRDGDLDLFIGNSVGNTLFFRNSGNSSAPAYEAASTNPFGITDVGTYAKPSFADVDGDGDLDLFMGKEDGNTLFFRNSGSSSAPAK